MRDQAPAPGETAARLVEDIEEHLLFQHDTPDEGEALLRRCLPLLAHEALTPEEWEMVYAACQFQWLNDSLPEAYDNALHQLGLKLAAMIRRGAA